MVILFIITGVIAEIAYITNHKTASDIVVYIGTIIIITIFIYSKE